MGIRVIDITGDFFGMLRGGNMSGSAAYATSIRRIR